MTRADGALGSDRDVVLRVLGPVRVRASQAWQVPVTAQLRLVVGMMAVRAGRVVAVDELIDALWDSAPPRSARGSLQSLMTRVRHLLEPLPGTALTRCGDGYRIELDADRIDVGRFRSLARYARAAEAADAIRHFDAALAQWTGPVLADAASTARVRMIRQGLEGELTSVIQDRFGCMLACDRLGDAAAELPGAVARFPLNESLAGMLMVTLYRSGQRAGALRVFRHVRGRLAGQLGVEPGPELQVLHRRILSGDASLAGPAVVGGESTYSKLRGPVVPRQLPAVPAPFVGRTAELSRLDETVDSTARPDDTPVVWLIVGPAGVGKSTLATYWAHRVAGSFPDGQLYLNLEGFSQARMVTPERAIRSLLGALGVPSSELPTSLAAQAALYRSMLAGKRVLVVLDNALSTEQVRALLPGDAGCAALVTSRAELDGLVVSAGARVMSLGVLSQAESRELITHRLGAGEPDAVAELAESCGGLPLALAVVTARAAARPGLPLTALAAELAGQTRLDALETPDRGTSVREVLSWSYRQLSQPAGRLFRLLGLHPGLDISVNAAASLAGTGPEQARRAVAELAHVHMAGEHSPGRYACHDLLLAYAAEQANAHESPDDRESARLRLVDYYLHSAVSAARLLYLSRDPVELDPPEPGAVPDEMRDRAQALAWFDAEHQVLLATIDAAAAAGHDVRAWKLATAIADYLDREGHWHDLAAIGQVALAAARRCGDRQGQAHAHCALGTACWRLGQPEAAQFELQNAIGLFRQVGAKARQARCHIVLGKVLDGQGRHAKARLMTEQALRLYRQLGHTAGEANALGDLGWHLAIGGNYHAAVACCRRAIGLHSEFGNPLGEAYAWDHLGFARHKLGDERTAVACYRRALVLLREVSDRPEKAAILTRLGDTYRSAGNQDHARAAWRQALVILDELHDLSASEIRCRLGWVA